ncbi:hypothetical protein EDB85DRAFT_1886464 [Lactarius pseudohatsudake]|nr:hypothetical protein EDB85DRAFT_1886464 [Lactarius pseudohatsudake]
MSYRRRPNTILTRTPRRRVGFSPEPVNVHPKSWAHPLSNTTLRQLPSQSKLTFFFLRTVLRMRTLLSQALPPLHASSCRNNGLTSRAQPVHIPQRAPNKSSPALHTRYTSAIYPCKNSRRTSSARSSATTTAEVCCTIARAVRVASTGHTNIWVEDTVHDEQHIWHLSAANVDLAQHLSLYSTGSYVAMTEFQLDADGKRMLPCVEKEDFMVGVGN